MKNFKTVDYIKISLDLKQSDFQRSCFVVYSSKENHAEIVIDSIENVIEKKQSFEVIRLSKAVKSGDSHYTELIDLLNSCTFAVVLLDGLRPNVIFEYGILQGLGKPCIVLLENDSKVDVINYYLGEFENHMLNPPIDMDKHFSDVKDRFYLKYDKNNPKEIRNLVENEFDKLKDKVDRSFIKLVFPEKDFIESEIESRLITLLEFADKDEKSISKDDELRIDIIIQELEKLMKKYKIVPTKKYCFLIAHIYKILARYEDSLQYVDKILSKDDDTKFLGLKAELLSKSNLFDEALQSIERALRMSPEYESFWHNKALILEKLDRNDEAILCYKKGVEVNKRCPTIHYHYAFILYENKDYERANTQIDLALQLKPTSDNFLVLKAMILQKFDKLDEARKNIEDALCYNGKNYNAWYRLGLLSETPEESIKYYEKALQYKPNHNAAQCSKATELLKLGEYADSVKIYSNILISCNDVDTCERFHSNYGKALYMKARGAEESDQKYEIKSAIQEMEKAIDLCNDDDSVGAFNNIGYMYLKLADFESAKRYFELAIKSCKDSFGLSLAYYNYAIVEILDNNYDKSLNLLKNSSSLLINIDVDDRNCMCLFKPELDSNNIILKEFEGSLNLLIFVEDTEQFIKSLT